MNFNQSLEQGLLGESIIARYLQQRGVHILPVYETEAAYKGPRMFLSDHQQLIAPDACGFKGGSFFWVEAKHKSIFTWHFKTRRHVTGIDLHHYTHYLHVRHLTEFPVYLFFLHQGGLDERGQPTPKGLYYGEILYLYSNENHRHQNHGRGGMVYWAESTLTLAPEFTLI